VLRDIAFDEKRYNSFIELQEKLHQNICRRRMLVAIGTHDLDAIQGPFRYDAADPDSINFVPLTHETRSFGGKELLDFYREDLTVKHLEPYTHLIYDSPVYPVIYDSNNVVLSLPPIINGRHSRIKMHTRNVFIECTATDYTKANIVLDTIVTMFSEYCAIPFTVEPVEITYEIDGRVDITPKLSYRKERARVAEINGLIGVELDPELMCHLCTKMHLGPVQYIAEAESIEVTVPPSRSDILHAVDVIEDVAIAYGYNNVPKRVPQTLTVGRALPINHFCDLLREEIGRAGYVEMLTHGLCSRDDNFSRLRKPDGQAVSLLNPANKEYQVVRTTLLPGALKTLHHNKSASFRDGIKLFEVSDVVLPCDNEIGAQNERRLVALYSAFGAGFEIVHGLADRIMTLSQIPPVPEYALASMSREELEALERVAKPGLRYYIRECQGRRPPHTSLSLPDFACRSNLFLWKMCARSTAQGWGGTNSRNPGNPTSRGFE
jgi:phenylalanyl-tRNA synthetase beta chain